MCDSTKLPCEGDADDAERSVMYRFLRNPQRFSWPDDDRKDGRWHYRFTGALDYRFQDLLEWQRRLDARERSKAAMVDQYGIPDEGQKEIPFAESFAVKGVSHADLFENEVKLMSDLRYVHVAALLATCEISERDYLLIFPVGCCDLREIMTCISHQIAGTPWDHPYVAPETLKCHEIYRWPFRKPLVQKLIMLQNFFFCLCQALKYLHDSNLRHKDIKPENIIIDFSGNVVLMDFGISKKVEGTEGITDSYGSRTGIYAPLEVHDDTRRGYQSDVYSLGCVFIQMATLLLGKNLKEFWEHCSTRQGAGKDHTLAKMPEKLQGWIEDLRESTKSPLPCLEDVGRIKASLSTISRMLLSDRLRRPKTNELLEVFDFQRPKCRDCNSDDPNERWEPSQQQKEERESGKIERLKLVHQNKNDLDHDPADYVEPKELAVLMVEPDTLALEGPLPSAVSTKTSGLDTLSSLEPHRAGTPGPNNGIESRLRDTSKSPEAFPRLASETFLGVNSGRTPKSSSAAKNHDVSSPTVSSTEYNSADKVFESDSSNDKVTSAAELTQLKRKFQRRDSELVIIYDCAKNRFCKWEFATLQGN
jgi:serine/threonine protein kinase